MDVISAPGDTWGISGPDFLAPYLGAGVVFIIVAFLFRLNARQSGPDHVASPPSRAAIAFLVGGRSQAMYSSLAGLRAAGAVDVAAPGILARTGPAPDHLNRIDHAVYDAAGRAVRVADLGTDPQVQMAVDELALTVSRSGWLVNEGDRARARLGAFPLIALAVLGLVRTFAGAANDRPVLFVVVATFGIAMVGFLFLKVPRLTPAAQAALVQAQRSHAHLAPSQSPSWATHGLAGAAMGVALYGTSALWAADPAFAQEAGIHRHATNAGGGYDGGSSSDSGGGSSGGFDGGGGSSCGGGGGCGGGGCGG